MDVDPSVALKLEQELQCQLQDAGIMRAVGLKEGEVASSGRQTRSIARRVIRPSVTSRGVRKCVHCAIVRGRSASPANIAKLRVIEDIEGFSAELEDHAFMHREAFKERHIEVGLARVAKDISASVAEGQAAGSSKGGGVSEERSKARITFISNSAKGVGNKVRVRAESSAV